LQENLFINQRTGDHSPGMSGPKKSGRSLHPRPRQGDQLADEIEPVIAGIEGAEKGRHGGASGERARHANEKGWGRSGIFSF